MATNSANITLWKRGNQPTIHYEFTINTTETVTNLTAREHQVNDIDGKPIEAPSFQEMLKQISIAESNQIKRQRIIQKTTSAIS